MAFPHQTECIASVVALYGFASCVHGWRTCIGSNGRCNLLGANITCYLLCRQYARFIVALLWLCFINEVERIAYTLNVARLQLLCLNNGNTTCRQGVVAELNGNLFTLQRLYRLLAVNLMSADTSVTSCTCVLRCIVHHIGNTVKGFTLDAFCFLTFCTHLFLFGFAESCGFFCNTSALCLNLHLAAVGCTGNLLPNGKFLFGCINSRLAFFLGCNLLGRSSTAFRLAFLQLLQCSFLVGNHSVCNSLCHYLVSIRLLYNRIPSSIAVGLLVERVALFVLWNTLHCRNILRGNVAVFGNIFRTIVTNSRTLIRNAVVLQQHIVEFITSKQVHTLSIDRAFGIYLETSVRIRIGCDASTNSSAVLISKGNYIVEGVLRSVLLLCNLYHLRVLLGSRLLELRQACKVGFINLLLNGLFCQWEHVSTVRHVYRAVPIIHDTLFISDNLHLYLCIIACNGVCVARVECNNTVNSIGCFLCILLTDSLGGCLFLDVRV